MAHWLALTCATCRLVASRDASGTLVAPEFRISSWVITWIADGTSVNFSGRLETDVTSRSISSSMLSFFSSPGDGSAPDAWAKAFPVMIMCCIKEVLYAARNTSRYAKNKRRASCPEKKQDDKL